MKIRRLIISITYLATFLNISFSQVPTRFDYCYENKKGICVYSKKFKKEIVTPIKGSWASLSPNGTEITYTQSLKNGDRNICIYSLNNSKNTILSVNSSHCYGSVWSPDGQYIAYNVLYDRNMNENWGISIIDSGNHQPIDVAFSKGFYSPSWTSDGKKILTHDMNTVFLFNLNGEIDTTYKIKEFGGSSAEECILTPDNEKIVFDATVDEPDSWHFGERPSAIFVYDIKSQKTIRISPVGYCCLSPHLDGNKIYFECLTPNSLIRNICSMDVDGKNFRIEFRDCSSFSISKN